MIRSSADRDAAKSAACHARPRSRIDVRGELDRFTGADEALLEPPIDHGEHRVERLLDLGLIETTTATGFVALAVRGSGSTHRAPPFVTPRGER